MEEFNLESQYQKYLKLVKLNESEMGETQRIVMKRTFYGSFGVALTVLRDDLSKLEEEKAVKTLQDMFDQVGNFFLNETNQHN
jgi:hypothetical protein